VHTESVVRLKLQFGHLVINPHWHDDAEITISITGELCVDPTDPSYLRGPDFVTFRSLISQYVEREIAGKLLVWAADLDLMDFGYEMPQHNVHMWPFPPTAETLAILVTSEAVRVADLMGACVESVEMWESVRSGIRFDKEAVRGAALGSKELLQSLNPSLVSAAYQGHSSLF